jgi:molybdenum cofactor cytidylyltransferase
MLAALRKLLSALFRTTENHIRSRQHHFNNFVVSITLHFHVGISVPAGTEGILLCLVDHPLISAELVCDLIDRFSSVNKPIVLLSYQGHRGHPVIFSSSLYEELLRTPLEMGARAVALSHADEVEELLTNEEGCVLNINDPDASQRALHHAN